MSQFSEQEFKSFFEAHYQGLKNFIYYKIGNMPVAQDLAQEAFLKVWEKRSEIDPETAKSYLFTIGNNLAINHGKHMQVRFENKTGIQDSMNIRTENPEEVLREKEFKERFEQAIDALPEPNRVAFLMHRVDKLKHKEIAERLGISEKGVQKRVKKALKELNESIGYRL